MMVSKNWLLPILLVATLASADLEKEEGTSRCPRRADGSEYREPVRRTSRGGYSPPNVYISRPTSVPVRGGPPKYTSSRSYPDETEGYIPDLGSLQHGRNPEYVPEIPYRSPKNIPEASFHPDYDPALIPQTYEPENFPPKFHQPPNYERNSPNRFPKYHEFEPIVERNQGRHPPQRHHEKYEEYEPYDGKCTECEQCKLCEECDGKCTECEKCNQNYETYEPFHDGKCTECEKCNQNYEYEPAHGGHCSECEKMHQNYGNHRATKPKYQEDQEYEDFYEPINEGRNEGGFVKPPQATFQKPGLKNTEEGKYYTEECREPRRPSSRTTSHPCLEDDEFESCDCG